ncbi:MULTISPECIES: YfiR family protein [unclassified Brenneria]|uniref:YfiR family protein n=1 Tax=unclassified Brenneria TaxID=2634434 RepID=UPI00155627F4|nr:MULTISPECIES: YfiR family protein [unclassified Brenneria]MBJ7221292.1 YfiR family protein [Brenneria sp. L3-3C-1]MEE3642536.1 YfiR family protein [Brenneria sp. L3_3C_1]MEE3650092.1 YfiR family protein [Brenneria sp. HEZEL_4_2_4]NPD00051.1 YfiR family protein [Brenneria sp. hezel4-2-4]
MGKIWSVFTLFLLFTTLVSAKADPSKLRDEMSRVSADQLYQTVAGIISYSHWPTQNKLPTLCIFSSAYFLSTLTAPPLSQKKPTFHSVILNKIHDFSPSRCDAVYFGQESVSEQIKIINTAPAHPLLTITEQNQECIYGSAFCLIFFNKKVSFSVNLDSLSRTGIRVNPEVLILARPQNGYHE